MEQEKLSMRASYIIAGIASAFCMAIISLLLLWGNPDNAMHYFGLTASFGIIILILTGFGFGSVAAPIISMISGKK